MNRTRVGACLASLLSITALAACGGGGGAGSSKTLTVTEWGGSVQKADVAAYVQPWADSAGVKILQDEPTDYAKLRAQVQSGKVSWGAVQVEPNFAVDACKQGLLEKIDTSVVDTSALDPKMVNPCAVPKLQYAFNIAYNTDTFPSDHPTTWKDFFDTKKYPGKRGFWKYASGGILEAALLADGVQPADLYPLDLDRAFKKLDTIKDDIVFYDTGDQQVQLLASGEAPLIQAWNGRIFLAAKDGQPVANEWGQHLNAYEQYVIPKGYPNAALAQQFLGHFVNDAAGQAKDAEETAYAPVNPAAMDKIDPEVAATLPTAPDIAKQAAATMDYTYWAEHYDEITQRFNEWLAS